MKRSWIAVLSVLAAALILVALPAFATDQKYGVNGKIIEMDPVAGTFQIELRGTNDNRMVMVDEQTTFTRQLKPAHLADFKPGDAVFITCGNSPLSSGSLRAIAVFDQRSAFILGTRVITRYPVEGTITKVRTQPALVDFDVRAGIPKRLELLPETLILFGGKEVAPAQIPLGSRAVADLSFIGFAEDEPDPVPVRGLFDLPGYVEIRMEMIYGPAAARGKVDGLDPARGEISVAGSQFKFNDGTRFFIGRLGNTPEKVVGKNVMLFAREGVAVLVYTDDVVDSIAAEIIQVQTQEETLLGMGEVLFCDPANGKAIIQAQKGKINLRFGPESRLSIQSDNQAVTCTLAEIKTGDRVVVFGYAGQQNLVTRATVVR